MGKDKTEQYKITKELEDLKEKLEHEQRQTQNAETLQTLSTRNEHDIEQAIKMKNERQQAFLSFVDERRQEILEMSC